MTARARGPRVGFGPLHRFAWYNRLQAWVLRRGFGPYDRFMAPFKQRLLGSLRGRVLEIGAGPGRELEFLGSDVRQFVAVEPNSFNLAGLRAEAARLGRAVQPVVAAAEALPFADAVFDGAISSLVLCTVHDPAAAVAELRRTLRPGGRFVSSSTSPPHAAAGSAGCNDSSGRRGRRWRTGATPIGRRGGRSRGRGSRAWRSRRCECRRGWSGRTSWGRRGSRAQGV